MPYTSDEMHLCRCKTIYTCFHVHATLCKSPSLIVTQVCCAWLSSEPRTNLPEPHRLLSPEHNHPSHFSPRPRACPNDTFHHLVHLVASFVCNNGSLRSARPCNSHDDSQSPQVTSRYSCYGDCYLGATHAHGIRPKTIVIHSGRPYRESSSYTAMEGLLRLGEGIRTYILPFSTWSTSSRDRRHIGSRNLALSLFGTICKLLYETCLEDGSTDGTSE
jgi:hypothetical protein